MPQLTVNIKHKRYRLKTSKVFNERSDFLNRLVFMESLKESLHEGFSRYRGI